MVVPVPFHERGPKKGGKKGSKRGSKKGSKKGSQTVQNGLFCGVFRGHFPKNGLFWGSQGSILGPSRGTYGHPDPHFIPVQAGLIFGGLNPCFEGFGRPPKEVATLKTGYFGQSEGQNGHLVARIGGPKTGVCTCRGPVFGVTYVKTGF